MNSNIESPYRYKEEIKRRNRVPKIERLEKEQNKKSDRIPVSKDRQNIML